MERYSECPDCLVELSSDSTINQLARLLAECSMMLENSMAPYIDAPDVNQWIEERRTLLDEIRRTLDNGNSHIDTEEVC